jgi:predicted flap endonuclease-1-like 5' DNA nuclease
MQDLPFQSPTQFTALVLTLIAGWLLGLGSSSGGRKWRNYYNEAVDEASSYRTEAETDLKEANRKIRDLEAECERLKKAVTEAEATAAAPVAPVAAAPAASDEAGAGWRGWFGWGRDNLSRIKGVDAAREKRLNELGIKTYREIEKMTPDDEAALEQRLEMEKGAIAREEWREQAALLRAGNEDEHSKRFA